jgi:hypothetical protein
MDEMDENTIQQNVVQMLAAYGKPDVLWFAVPNGEARTQAIGAKLKRQGVRAGAADLMFVIAGHVHGVELKTEKNGPKPNQIAFKLDLERAGGTYHLCHGLAATVDCLKSIGAFQPNVTFTFPQFPIAAAGAHGVHSRPRSESGVGRIIKTVREAASRRRPARS